MLLSDIPNSALIRVNGATEMGLIDFENTVYRLALSQDKAGTNFILIANSVPHLLVDQKWEVFF